MGYQDDSALIIMLVSVKTSNGIIGIREHQTVTFRREQVQVKFTATPWSPLLAIPQSLSTG